MRYWLALVFLRDFGFEIGRWTPISLDEITKALNCTRRNAQLVIKRLAEESIIDWKPGVGRGNLPQLLLKESVHAALIAQAKFWMNEGKADQALNLIRSKDRDQFIAEFVSQYQQQDNDQDILQIPFYRATHSLIPYEISRRTELHIADYLYASLLRLNRDTGQLEGDLAQIWEHTGDTLKVRLRKSLKFWDGSALTAFDVKAAYESLLSSNSVSRGLFLLIDEFSVVDAYTLRIRSKRLSYYLPRLLAHGALSVFKLNGDGSIVGSGAFRLAEQTDYRTLLTVSPHYHGYRPWLDGVEIWNMGLSANNFQMHCDIVHGSSAPDIADEFTQVQQWEEGCIYACLNSANNAWMKLAKHRLYIQQLLQSLPMNGVRDTMIYRRASGMTSFEPLKLGKAVDLSSVNPVPLEVLTYQLPGHIEAAENITELLCQHGLDSNLTVLPYPEFDQVERQSKADIIVSGEVFGEHKETSWLGWLLCTNTVTASLNKQSKPWLEQQVFDNLAQSDESKRVQGYQRIERELIRKAIYIPLFQCAQDMRISHKVNAMNLLTNGWFDFNQVVFESR